MSRRQLEDNVLQHYRRIYLIFAAFSFTSPLVAFELPPQITPAIREACEADVRRFCIRSDSTPLSVKLCVLRKVERLNNDCRKQLAVAGLISDVRRPEGSTAEVFQGIGD